MGENHDSTADPQASLQRVREATSITVYGAGDAVLPVLVGLGGVALGLLLYFT